MRGWFFVFFWKGVNEKSVTACHSETLYIFIPVTFKRNCRHFKVDKTAKLFCVYSYIRYILKKLLTNTNLLLMI